MHMHRLEKWWLVFGISMLAIFLLVLGTATFAMGVTPPGEHRHTVNPETVTQNEPFDKPGLRQVGDNEYEAVILAFVFGYSPDRIELPVGAKVNFVLTSTDVVHGFHIIGTNVNMMAVPGEVNHTSYTFKEPGEYLVLCNEYCGAAHEQMQMRIIVK